MANRVAKTTASTSLSLEGTKRAFRPPRVTTTEMNAIASPGVGMIVFNTTLGGLCQHNGSSWQELAEKADANQAVFSAGRTPSQIISSTATTKVLLNTTTRDSNSDFDTVNSKFKPTIAGDYTLTAHLTLQSVTAGLLATVKIYKNGVLYAHSEGQYINGSYVTVEVTAQVTANGSTDYFEVYIQSSDSYYYVHSSTYRTYFIGTLDFAA